MQRISTALFRRFADWTMIDGIAVSLGLLAAPAMNMAARSQPPPPNPSTIQEPVQPNNQEYRHSRQRAQSSQAETSQAQSSEERQALDQKPTLSDDVRLRIEVYTGNDYPK